ncbi:MAG: ORF6N domain-containing protein [Spirochaetaceae bacterium]|jgi:hypothetical protein|nr:ORF6N domain-containing protein [Spirochaetaceae bacterium]
MDEALQLENMIYEIRGHKVMLDSDLARLYQVETKRLNEAVRRNSERFPVDFMFRLTEADLSTLKSQNATSNDEGGRGGRRYLPYAFTEQGVSMLSSVLRSDRAVKVNIQIMRTFVKMRSFVFAQTDINEQIAELRKLLLFYMDKNDERVSDIVRALNNLVEKPPTRKPLGFKMEP